MFENEYGEKNSRKNFKKVDRPKEKVDIDGFHRKRKLEPCRRIKPNDLTKYYLDIEDEE
jgi:hypothetical protein